MYERAMVIGGATKKVKKISFCDVEILKLLLCISKPSVSCC